MERELAKTQDHRHFGQNFVQKSSKVRGVLDRNSSLFLPDLLSTYTWNTDKMEHNSGDLEQA
jgi:hypothetical protein